MAASRRHPAKRQRLDGHSRPILDTSENVHYHVPLQISDTCELVPTSEELLELAGYGDESQTIASKEQERVCFGMVPSILGRVELLGLPTTEFTVCLESSDRFSATNDPGRRGSILSDHGQMIKGLLDERTLELYVTCTVDNQALDRRTPSSYSQMPSTLTITVYGPLELFEPIGCWFQEYDVYLQDPRTCHLDVRYCNPHRLSSEDLESCPWLSEVVSRRSGLAHLQDIIERPDLLDILSGQDDLEETAPPGLIKAELRRHQRQALTFMLRREKGWSFDNKNPDIWEVSDTSQGRYFVNRISDTHQDMPPPQFLGGVIADPMGLGKTLTMIALIATDSETFNIVEPRWDIEQSGKRSVGATLIIVPQPLMGTWEDQLSEHVTNDCIKFCRHHGKSRLTDIAAIDAVNVVLTTYHTLSADWKTWKANDGNLMFSVQWKRIILDEAHTIRNMRSRMARAICELESLSRWAVTGTPIQNHLNDLAALFKFIRVHPYDDPKRFEADISRLWKSGEDEEAVKRLKRLSSCLILRRAKDTIDLPPRHNMQCPVDFSKDERALYEKIRQQTITKIDDALLHESELSTTGVYVNFLQQIESMRLICNLGLRYHTRHDRPATHEASQWSTVAQETFNIQRDMETIVCSQCSSVLDFDNNNLLDEAIQDTPQFSRCLKYACAECAHKIRLSGHKMVCGHTPRCPIAPISVSNSAFEETPSHLSHTGKILSSEVPSKVQVLTADLKALPADVKSIVFSTWRLTLDIVEASLIQAGIRSVRFDGKVPQTQRQSVLTQFRSDPDIRVMLLTLSCGAVGLTLTEASRAYLMEPHWNPTIEEQALARIHRIGQTREVTTVRFYIRDSFEERVMEVQESKKNLAGVLLSGHDGGHADDSLGALQRLRSLL